jgi:hypothetical protein
MGLQVWSKMQEENVALDAAARSILKSLLPQVYVICFGKLDFACACERVDACIARPDVTAEITHGSISTAS